MKFHKEDSLLGSQINQKKINLIIKMWIHQKNSIFLFFYFSFLPNAISKFVLNSPKLIWIVQINVNYFILFYCCKINCCVLIFILILLIYFHIIGIFVSEIFQFVFWNIIILFQNGILWFFNTTLYYSTTLPKQIQHIICVSYVQHETCDNENFKIFIKLFSLNPNLKKLHITFILRKRGMNHQKQVARC
jgi:hypothetical protein